MHDYGFLSILPAALSIFLAIYTRNVIVSLSIGSLLGAIILANFNPFFAVVDLVEQHLFAQLSNGANSQVLIVSLVIGGFIALLEKSGGAASFSSLVTRFVSNPVRGQTAAWLAGIAIFFTDSGNALIVGPLFRPIFKKLKICKEKLAYIIDTTAAPVSILVPFIGWGVYIMSLMENAFQDIGSTDQPFQVLLEIWPYQFYALLSLFAIPMLLSTRKDFGPMLKAQQKYDQAMQEGADDKESIPSDPALVQQNIKLSTFLLPISVLLFSVSGFLIFFAFTEGVGGVHVRSGIFISYLLASITCAFIMKRNQDISFAESLTQFFKGMEKLVYICSILVLAWTLGSVCKDLHTGNYLAGLIGGTISPSLLPAMVFILGALMSFATGSSYGTFAILMIIVVPVADTLGAPMVITIAAVLSGGLFGDHTSPISDTTALASMGSGCQHIDHVSTQLSYALISGAMALFGFVLAGYFQQPMIVVGLLAMQFVVIRISINLFGKRTSA
ncbi:MAG: Na+/H+ antiporter NhaC family protein [Enterobacterales bacterium]|nr:Na+/H+ antiporter NhaC family protein [Enterobacterales bacterium]